MFVLLFSCKTGIHKSTDKGDTPQKEDPQVNLLKGFISDKSDFICISKELEDTSVNPPKKAVHNLVLDGKRYHALFKIENGKMPSVYIGAYDTVDNLFYKDTSFTDDEVKIDYTKTFDEVKTALTDIQSKVGNRPFKKVLITKDEIKKLYADGNHLWIATFGKDDLDHIKDYTAPVLLGTAVNIGDKGEALKAFTNWQYVAIDPTGMINGYMPPPMAMGSLSTGYPMAVAAGLTEPPAFCLPNFHKDDGTLVFPTTVENNTTYTVIDYYFTFSNLLSRSTGLLRDKTAAEGKGNDIKDALNKISINGHDYTRNFADADVTKIIDDIVDAQGGMPSYVNKPTF